MRGRGGPLNSTETRRGDLCKNDGTNRDAVWVVDSSGPRFPSEKDLFGEVRRGGPL